MQEFFKKYIPAVLRTWWGIVGFLFGLVGIISGALGINILVPYWVWVSVGIVALITSQFLVYDKVRKERDEARDEVKRTISELESEVIELGAKSIRMAELFWRMGDSFVKGIFPRSIPGGIYKVVEGADKDGCNKAWGDLKRRLRLLGLICDVQRPHPFKGTGYIEIVLTSLGGLVLNELDKGWRGKRMER